MSSEDRTSRALIVRHGPQVDAGHLGERARELGFALTEIDTEYPADVAAFDLVIVLGSPESVYDPDVAWVPDELRMLDQAVERDVPVLGICFGSQSLATALGGTVGPAATPEFGWFMIESREPSLIPEGPWLLSHRDVFTVPPGAVELARSTAGPQAYTLGPHMGIQFHPEVTVQTLDRWAEHWVRDLDGLVTPAQAASITAEARARRDEYRLRGRDLFDMFLARVRARGHLEGR